MGIYLKNGYLNIEKILSYGTTFNFIVGARGTGKTYSSLKHCVIDHQIPFIYMRRTQTQCDTINKPAFSVLKKINEDFGKNIQPVMVTNNSAGYYEMKQDESGTEKPSGKVLGYTLALSTISNARSFDMQDMDLLIYDEFIPEAHDRPIKNEAIAFFNGYESIARNRELMGRDPLKVLALANSNDLANPIFISLNLVTIIDRAQRSGQSVYIDRNRGIGIFLLGNSPISDQKKDTALYKMVGESDFSAMALGNDFAFDERTDEVNRKLKEYKPLVNVGEISIYRHKSKDLLYVSQHRSGSAPAYGSTPTELKRFQKHFAYLRLKHLYYKVEFERYICESLFMAYLK